MLSIIISSRDISLFNQLAKNIDETVGCEYEIIRIENLNYFGICKAYNLGVAKAKYDNFCFVHEDVLFRTSDWGKTICEILNDPKIGLIGIAGQTYRSKMPSTWYSFCAPENSIALNIIQHNEQTIERACINPENKHLTEVIVCDGVFLCSRRDVLAKYSFDENTFKNFHFYDLDFALSIRNDFKSVVTFDVLIEHFSIGKLDKRWIKEALKFYKKWNKSLPLSLNKIEKTEIKKIETSNMESIYFRLIYQFSFDSFILLLKTVPLHIIVHFSVKKIVNKIGVKNI